MIQAQRARSAREGKPPDEQDEALDLLLDYFNSRQQHLRLEVALTGAFLTGAALDLRIGGYRELQERLESCLPRDEWSSPTGSHSTYDSGGGFASALPLGRVPQCSALGLSEYVEMHDRHDLTDDAWELLEPHLPGSTAGRAGRPWADHRRVVNAVLWRTRAGAAWRDVPAGYGPWKTVYNRHRRWSADGTWDRLLGELQRGSDAGFESWDVGVDSTVIRAHQHAAGAPHTPPSDVPAERLAVALEDFESTRARTRRPRTGG